MKLHVGCGPIYIEGMVNIDIESSFKTDICADILTLDFATHVDLIWSCHFLEHLAYPQDTVKCLNLFHQWLKPGGLLRLAVPDLEKVANMYVNKSQTLYTIYGYDTSRYYKKGSRAEHFMFFARGWEHQILFDFELLKDLLIDAGFKEITHKQWGESKLGHWPHDRMPAESLYVEAIA